MRARSKNSQRESQQGTQDVATREQLLIAAGELMAERGVSDVSLSDIAIKSGLNSALVKYYFGNKAGLMIALLRKVLGPAMLQLHHLSGMKLPPEEKLRIHISGMVMIYFQYPYINRLMHQLLSDEPDTFGSLIAQEFSAPVAAVQKHILDEGFAAGTFRKIDPLLFYFHIVGACDQLFFGRYQLEHVFGIKAINNQLKSQFIDHLYSVVLDGISATSKEP
ncbi:TetR family transcriptional regulator [Sphingobium sp. HBC34]|uniref:TetR family transcriptional regulator n=1 Tax=Sphingobium cyanobacteriorum TaxID=3063954 RepID=A0ABT8ZPK4_9SPHN|nr:TetR family transcriptional regulator [Sphingobium sp. HBC34]MDO7836475.1 TetR family transcriptional regulator [Sphingobium sp. HBC34]